MRKIKVLACIISLFLCQGSVFVIDPVKNAVWHNEKGLYFLELNYDYAAMKEFQLAIALNPESEVSATFYHNLGLIYFKLGDYDNAQKSFENAINLCSNYIKYYENLIKTYKKVNILNKIIKKHEKIVLKDKNNFKSFLMLGLIYKNYENNALAIKYLSEFKRLAPDLGITKQINMIIKELYNTH